MRLNFLELEKFRNYEKLKVDTNSDLVLILGENAAGKTNLLESVYFLSRLKSFRVSDNLLVKFQEDYFKLTANLEEKNLEALVQISPRVKRSFKIDQKNTPRTTWGAFKTVLFVPSDLNLFLLGPGFRRRYLNETLGQSDKMHAADLASLDHVLKQRSALLDEIYKKNKNTDELVIWNEQLAELTIRVSRVRRKFIDFLNSKFNELYKTLTGFKDKFDIIYKGLDKEISQDKFLELLSRHEAAELRSGLNLVGPHRDDFIVEKDNQLNIYNSSRGEQREQILAIKLLQAEYLSGSKDKPIILLDDVFSELDEERRIKLLENLSPYQIFITSTEEHHLPKLDSSARVLKVENNKII